MIPLISQQRVTTDDRVAEVTTYQGATSLQIHAMGFLEISIVAARAAMENRTAIDAITPSIIYATRHAAELFLKHVVTELSDKHGLSAPVTTGHVLQELFTGWRAHIESCLDYEAEHDEHANFDRRAWLAEFCGIIRELHRVDPDGQTLRYPTDTKGAPNLGGKMLVSMGQLELFAHHAAECFSRFSERGC
jgi:hypothetical protein